MFEPATSAPDNPEQALYCVFHGANLLADMSLAEPCLLPADTIRFLAPATQRQVFLGYWHGRPCFARELDTNTALDAPNLHAGNLYQILGRVPDPLFALAGRAQQLLHWDNENQFCGRCGDSMENHASERARTCEPCGSMVYPRIAPCIIVLVSRGEEMLLARNANFPVKMFSTLAGFIEAGESAEECLVREVKEEVGVDVGNIRYFNSQSWPFPNQLMLGFFAEYSGGDIVCEEEEIAEAHWFKPNDLPTIPPVHSISGQLIRHHVDQYL
ncbi:MAG: NAD(+) diphosphatase [Halieaceae bacterium]